MMAERRALNRLPVHQREHGFNAMRRLVAASALPRALLFTIVALVLVDEDTWFLALLPLIYYSHKWLRARYGGPCERPLRIRLHRRIHDYNAADFRLKFRYGNNFILIHYHNTFRFHQNHAPAVMRCLGIQPDMIYRCDNGYRFHAEEGFLIMLMRMASYHRLTDMESEFGIYYDEIDRVFLTMLDMIVEENYEKLFDNIDYFVPRLETYNHAIRNKILTDAEFNDLGIQLFPCAHDTALFCDGTRWEVARPIVHQNRLYNGKDRVHCFEFQGISAPDGMIVDLYGPVPGRHHDQWMLDHSIFNERLAHAQAGLPIQFKAYSDKGYANDTHIYAAYRGQNLPLPLRLENYFMSMQRIGIEWAFNKVCMISAFVDSYKVQKVQLSAVGKVYWLAAILANANTRLYGSEASTYWGVKPPTLGSYFGYPEFDFDMTD